MSPEFFLKGVKFLAWISGSVFGTEVVREELGGTLSTYHYPNRPLKRKYWKVKKINIYNKKILFRDLKISCFVNKHFSTILNSKVISKKKPFSKNRWRNRKNLKNHCQNLVHNFLESLLIPLSFLAKVLFGTKFRNKLKNQFRIFAMLWLNNFWT